MTNKIAVELEKFFLTQGYEWIDQNDERFIPTAEQIEQGLDNMRSEVLGCLNQAGEDEYVTLMAGRLFMVARDGHLDVYVHAGELPLED